MAENMKLSENVILVDVSFLNLVIEELKRHFEGLLDRKLREVNVADLFVLLACDIGIEPGDNKIQVLLIYDEESSVLMNCIPSDVKKELDNVAFRDIWGEFSFFSFHPDNMVSLEELYLESLKVVADAKEVKRLTLLSFNEKYGEKVTDILKRVDGKEIVQFRMNEPEGELPCRWEVLAYPVMQALGVKGDEL